MVQMKAEDGDIVERRRLAACCWGEGRPATCLVMLDEQGSLTDILYLPSFSGQQKVIRAGVEYSIQEDPRKVLPPPSICYQQFLGKGKIKACHP